MTTGTFAADRWPVSKIGATMQLYSSQATAQPTVIPGTNFRITNCILNTQVQTAQASLAAGDLFYISQVLEGPQMRELASDVFSVSLLVYSSVANLKFAFSLRDSGNPTKSLVKLCTVPVSGIWNLIQLPNLPAIPSGNFFIDPGQPAAYFTICLACGSTYIAPATDTWQNGNFVGAPGMSNFAATLNNQFLVGMVQMEPGPICTQFIDKPFAQNLDECQRYYSKSASYAVRPVQGGQSFLGIFLLGTTAVRTAIRFPKRMAVTPSMLTCGLTAATNAVYLDASAAAAFVQSYASNETEVNSITLAAAGPATGGLSVLGEWAADTGW